MALARRTLEGCDVLITRPAGRGGRLERQLEQLGARVHRRPTIAFEAPADGDAVNEAIERLGEYDWVLFSSPTGVRFFDEALRAADAPGERLRARLGAVGRGTAKALAERGRPASLVAAEGHAEGFARALKGQLVAGDRALIVRPEVARSVLAEAVDKLGGAADEVVFYRTVAAPGIEGLAREVAGHRFEAAIFTSPSTLLRLIDAVPSGRDDVLRALAGMACVAIGEVTASAFRRLGLPAPAVAASPTDEGILAAMRALLAG